jgi:hypothetical protein
MNQRKTEQREKRKYTTRACDQCRHSRIKCENDMNYTYCKKCREDSKTCTFERKMKKRGRPKTRKNHQLKTDVGKGKISEFIEGFITKEKLKKVK